VAAKADPAAPGRWERLREALDPGSPVAVQTHDFPDIDAVASAWSLARLLGLRGFRARPLYRGEIRSRSLKRLIAELAIELDDEPPADPALQVIVVDGSPANGNVSLVAGRLVAILDHHNPNQEALAPFVDIRPELASCSALVHGYWVESGEKLPGAYATALLAGIQSDTDFLSRRTSPEDLLAWTLLSAIGEFDKASRIVRTVLDLRELDLVARAILAAEVRDGLLWTMIPGPSGQEVLAILAEFVLRAEELRAAVVAERGEGGIHLSIRSKDPGLSAFDLARRALEGIGTGGGHSHSAGGFIPAASSPSLEMLRERFFALASRATS
jgi:nanoRNase/pAp phosphatase (c-di-AMP/oligoRNAs hydrolase)